MTKTIEITNDIFERLESWVDQGRFDSIAEAANYAIVQYDVLTDFRRVILDEVNKIKAYRLSERLTQMEELDRSVKAHIEVLAGGIIHLNRPWWRRLFWRKS